MSDLPVGERGIVDQEQSGNHAGTQSADQLLSAQLRNGGSIASAVIPHSECRDFLIHEFQFARTPGFVKPRL